jgi:pimeloyl-ACP methyl ester carboxylesterase
VVEAVAAGIPGARFAVFANGAHLVNVERPAEFNQLLEEHL